MKTGTLSIVIPVYDEEEIVASTTAEVVRGARSLDLSSFEVILCENGSTDGTRALCRELAATYPEVKVIELADPDYGAAMRAGFLAATGEVIVNFDADYYDLAFLRDALEAEGDIVVAAKGILGSNDTRVVTRRVISRAFGWFVRRLLDVAVAETHGMKLFHRAAIAALLPEVRSTKDLFDTELVARAEWSGRRIAALPVTTKEMRHSRSGILRRIPRTIWGLMKLRVQLREPHALRLRTPAAPESVPEVAA